MKRNGGACYLRFVSGGCFQPDTAEEARSQPLFYIKSRDFLP